MNVSSPQRLRRWALALLFAAGSTAVLAQATAPGGDDKTKSEEKKSASPKEGAPTNLQKAQKAFEEGKFDKDAIDALQKAVEEDRNLGTPRVVLSRWLYAARKGSEARGMLEQAMAEAPTHPECYLLNGSYALAEGRISDAILSLEKALELGLAANWPPEQKKHFKDEALSGLAMAYERRGDWYSVKRNLLEFDRNNPGNTQILLRLARANLFLDSTEEAAKTLEMAYAKDKNLDPPELVMAQFWANRGDDKKFKDKAEEWFKQAKDKYNAEAAMAKKSEDREVAAKVYKAYAEWMLSQGNMPAAKAHLDAVTKLEPNARETLGLQGLVLRYEGKHSDAAKLFEQALIKSPSFAYAMSNLALSLCESSDAKERARGREQAEQYQKQNAQNADGYAVLGYALIKQNDPKLLDEADRYLGAVAQSGAVNPDTAYYIALLLSKREKYDEAKKILDEAIEKHKTFIYRAEAEKLQKEVAPKVKKKDPEPKDPAPKK